MNFKTALVLYTLKDANWTVDDVSKSSNISVTENLMSPNKPSTQKKKKNVPNLRTDLKRVNG